MTVVRLTTAQYRALQDHLFSGKVEQVAFAFADWQTRGTRGFFRTLDLELIPSTGFALQSAVHIELSEYTQARIIKAAFDRCACLVEFHSHRSRSPAQFSWSDLDGFKDFVPHVRWRLGGRPYAAAVFHKGSFDGLVWHGESPVPLKEITVGDRAGYRATGLTLTRPRDGDE